MAEAPVPVMGTPVSATIRAEPGSPSHVYLWPVAMGEAPADALAVDLRCSRCPRVWGMSGDLGVSSSSHAGEDFGTEQGKR